MRAIQGGSDSAVALAGKLRITKQAAAKTIATLEARGYVTREIDRADARRRPLLLTPRGQDMLAQGHLILNDVRRIWAETVGDDRLADVERALRMLVRGSVDGIDTAAWLTKE